MKCGFVAGANESTVAYNYDQVDANEVLDALVAAGVVSYNPRSVLIDEMDVTSQQ